MKVNKQILQLMYETLQDYAKTFNPTMFKMMIDKINQIDKNFIDNLK